MINYQIPPSQREKMRKDDIRKRQERATAYATKRNKTNAREIAKEKSVRDNALELLSSKSLPKEDVLFYIAQSEGISLEDWEAKRDYQFSLELAQQVRLAKSEINRILSEKYEEEEQSLRNTYGV